MLNYSVQSLDFLSFFILFFTNVIKSSEVHHCRLCHLPKSIPPAIILPVIYDPSALRLPKRCPKIARRELWAARAGGLTQFHVTSIALSVGNLIQTEEF